MTKIFITVSKDVITKGGRQIEVTVITDNELVNLSLKAPFKVAKTFDVNETLQKMKKQFVQDIKGVVINSETTVEKNSLLGKEFEVEV